MLLALDAASVTSGMVNSHRRLAQDLSKRGIHTVVVSDDQFYGIPTPYPGIKFALCHKKSGRSPASVVRTILRELQPDAVHIALEGGVGFGTRQACLAEGVPFTTSFSTNFPLALHHYLKIPSVLSMPLSVAALRWFHGPAAAILTPAPSGKETLQQWGFGDNIRVWTRGVNHDLFYPRWKNKKPDPREIYGAALERPILLNVGRVAPEKGIDDFAGIEHPGSKVVVGKGPRLAEYVKRFPHVRFMGERKGEELARMYAAADVFVFPSGEFDTLGLVQLEAMASGLPVAAYDAPAPRDVIGDSGAGVLHSNLSIAVSRALEVDPNKPLARAALYTWERMVDGFLEHAAPIHWDR